MSTPHPVPITGITGGSEGLAATYARVLALAATYDTAGNRMRGWAAAGARILANGDLVESAVLAPVSFARAEAAVVAATSGPDGILVESLGWETDAVLIRVAVRVLQETDDLVHGAFEVVDYLVGRTPGLHPGRLRPRPARRRAGRRAPGARRVAAPATRPPAAAPARRRRSGSGAPGLAGREPRRGPAPRRRRRRAPRRPLGRPHPDHARRAVRHRHLHPRHRVGGRPARGALRRRLAVRRAPDRPPRPQRRHPAGQPRRRDHAPRPDQRPLEPGPPGEQRHHRGPDDQRRPRPRPAHRLPARHRRHGHVAVDPGRRRARPGDEPPADPRRGQRLPRRHPRGDARGGRRAGTTRCCWPGTPRAGWRRPPSSVGTTTSTSPTS